MPIDLTNPININVTITQVELNSFTHDYSERQIHISYDELDAAGTVVVKDNIVSVSGQAYRAMLGALRAHNANPHRAVKLVALDYLAANAGRPGTVSDAS